MATRMTKDADATPWLLNTMAMLAAGLVLTACGPGDRVVPAPPPTDSVEAKLRSEFRLDMRVAYQAAGAEGGVVHVWSQDDSVAAPVELELAADSSGWVPRIVDPAGVVAHYRLDADESERRAAARWRRCLDDGRSRLACAARGHRFLYQSLTSRRGMPSRFQDLPDLDMEAAFAQLFDPDRGWAPIVVDDRRFEHVGSYPDSAAALVYFHAADTLFAWVLDDRGVAAAGATPVGREPLVRSVVAYRQRLANEAGAAERAPTRSGVRGTPGVRRPEIDVPGTLLPPAIAHALDDVARLIVVPVLNLGTVPFAALPTGGDALIDGTTVSVAPSLWDLLWEYAHYGRGPLTGLVVGNPMFRNTEDWSLPQLPGAEAEAEVVASLLDSAVVLTGERATEEEVREWAGRRILHLATHGIADAGNPLHGSFLALANGDRLTAAEIQERWGGWADLVVMSACQTGLGMTDLGGIIGIARAFHLTHSLDIVMSLWNVDDQATIYLMRRFYTHLRERPSAEALRLASLDTRDRYPRPAIWAAFTILSLQQQS